MRVTTVRKGYFGGKIRDAGEAFDLPDALMRDGLKPSWVEAEGETPAPLPPDGEGEAVSAPRKRGRKPKATSAPAERTSAVPVAVLRRVIARPRPMPAPCRNAVAAMKPAA